MAAAAPPHSEEVGLAVLATKIDHLTDTVVEIKQALATSTTIHVPRSEWELYNESVAARFKVEADDRAKLWAENNRIEAKKAPWWAVVAVIGTMVMIVVNALQWVPNVVN